MIQNTSNSPPSAEIYFRLTQMDQVVPKDLNIYNLHYVDARRDFLRSQHDTTPPAVDIKRILQESSLWCKKRTRE